MATKSELLALLQSLSMNVATLELVAQRCTRELELLLKLATSLDQPESSTNHEPAPLHLGRYTVHRTTFSVCDGTRVCELGNTIYFRFFECLAREPDRCFTREQLLAVVWDGQRRSATTVRSAIFELRRRLRNAGMDELAEAIRFEGRAYGLKLND